MMSMDTAARALDAMLHQGYAEERDGGVWLDDLAARQIGEECWTIVAKDYPEIIEELKRDIACLESDVRRWRKASKKASKANDMDQRRLRAIRNVVAGRGKMSDKLAVIREIAEGREDVLGP